MPHTTPCLSRATYALRTRNRAHARYTRTHTLRIPLTHCAHVTPRIRTYRTSAHMPPRTTSASDRTARRYRYSRARARAAACDGLHCSADCLDARWIWTRRACLFAHRFTTPALPHCLPAFTGCLGLFAMQLMIYLLPASVGPSRGLIRCCRLFGSLFIPRAALAALFDVYCTRGTTVADVLLCSAARFCCLPPPVQRSAARLLTAPPRLFRLPLCRRMVG